MTGGLIQLVSSSGEQDMYIIGDPQISFFKTVYRRHTNFAIETVDEIFDSGLDFGRLVRFAIPRKADLLSNITLYIKLGTLNPE